MAGRVLILRPQPGADRTAASACKLGLDPVVAPIFTVRPLPWTAPHPAGFDAVMLTSANAVRHAGPQLDRFKHLPCYAVGEATGAVAREAGFDSVEAGPADAAALAPIIAASGAKRILHLSGADRVEPIDLAGVEPIAVYRSEVAPTLPSTAVDALASDSLVLVHSPRAGALFAHLADAAGVDRSRVMLAAISRASAEAAGTGWADLTWAAEPRDQALLELAAKLCNTGDSRS